MAPPSNVILLACGSFNPPTIMHLRMFEIARDHLHRLGLCTVIGGIVSPVHDSYGKKDLVSASHRCNMLKLALQNSDWVKLSDWECNQESWSRTRTVLQHHQNQLNSVINANDSPNKRLRREDLLWVPGDVKSKTNGPVQIKLLCGADLLESFGTPGLWKDEDIDDIVGHHGLVVVTRNGSNPYSFIYESDILTKHQNNIVIVTEWITNDVSSTKIRRALRRSESVKYLIPDAIIDYILKHGLFDSRENKYLMPETNNMQSCFLTPSPSDVVMASPEPTFDDKNHHENVFSIPIMNGPISYILTECSKEIKTEQNFSVSEKFTNEENSRRSNSIGFPGQAVQVIATMTGDKVTSRKGMMARPACLL